MEYLEKNEPRAYDINYAKYKKKISWGAIIAGVLVALVTMLLLNLLGIGIGVGSINPATEENPMSGLGTGALIWWIISNLIAIFLGAYVASRTAGMPLKSIGILHGVVMWCTYTLISFWLLTTAIGGIISGVGSVVSQTVSTVASGVESLIGGTEQGQNQTSGQNLQLSDIASEVKQLLSQTDDPALQPDSISEVVQQTKQNIMQTIRNDTLTEEDLQAVFEQVVNKTEYLTQQVDQEDVVNILEARTDLSGQTINNLANIIISNVEQAQQKFQQFLTQAQEESEQVTQDITEAVSSAAIWSFFALLFGLGAAIGGGIVGEPKKV